MIAIDEAEKLLGHDFADKDLLREALTHPSAADSGHYQRLEFLGDRVLGLVIADALFRLYPDAAEGELNRRLASLVRRETLASVARGIGLGRFMILDAGAESEGVRDKDAALADIAEAVIGAIWRDGGLAPARAFIERHWSGRLARAPESWRDAKTALQEWAQGRGLPLPSYRQIARSGPDHEPLFTIRVAVAGAGEAEGTGTSKRLAEQDAARCLLGELGGACES